MSTYAEDNITITSQKSVNDKIENLNQYFWYEETGTHAGAHITEIPQEDFESNPQGGNLLATSSGLAVRDGMTELATFGANGVIIGQLETGKSRSELSASGMQVIQKGSGATDVPIANLGYGQGLNASGGLSDAPYYTLGVRKANSGIGNYSNAEGYNTEASGYVSHAEGRETTSSGYGSHAEGYLNDASGRYAHAEGGNGEASGDYGSHSEGAQCVAGGDYGSHAEGFRTEALGDYGAHAQNYGTKASSRAQTALGKYNVEDSNGDYAVILGNGTSDNARANALTIDWQGNVDIKGEYRVNGSPIGGGGVTGVKGNAESAYRTGNVNLTPANIGAVPTSRTVNGKALSSNVTLKTSDLANDSGYLDTNTVKDYVTEQGTENGWIYRKWNSGISECWYKEDVGAIQGQYSNGGGYDTGTTSARFVLTPSNFPANLFIDTPIVDCTIRGRERAFYSVPSVNPTATAVGSWYGHRNAQLSSNQRAITFQFYCIGEWK